MRLTPFGSSLEEVDGHGGHVGVVGATASVDIPDGYRDFGFQVTGLIFPTPGCWEVTAQVGDRKDSRLVFTVRVVKIGIGPTGYPAHEATKRSS
jgi:hypothetical protein